jgi:hypothetical protein
MADTAECPICCYDFDAKKFVKCAKCQNEICIDCCKRYILEDSEEASCMNPSCGLKWSYRFMVNNFPKKWISGPSSKSKNATSLSYKEHIKNIYLEKEKSKLPEVVKIANRYKRIPDMKENVIFLGEQINMGETQITFMRGIINRRRKIGDLKKEKSLATQFRKETRDKEEIQRLFLKIKEYNSEIKETRELNKRDREDIKLLKIEIRKYKDTRYEIEVELCFLKDKKFLNEIRENEKFPEEQKVKYIFPCPMEGCKGLVEKKSFKCGICESNMCRKCRSSCSEKEDKHVCDENDLKSVSFLKEDTKSCPQCVTPIHKIDGCDQMFCPNCKAGFSWRTGKLEMGKMHNPHWYEWMRENGGQLQRNPDDLQCGGVPRLFHLNMHKTMRINGNAMNMERRTYESDENPYIFLRVKYMTGEISEKEWKQSIYLRRRYDKKNEIMTEMERLLGSMAGDIFRELSVEPLKKKAEEECLEKLEKLRIWGNEIIIEEMKLFGFMKPVLLDSSWHTVGFDSSESFREILIQ